MTQEFAYLKANASRFLAHPEASLTKEGLVELICRDCQFWREDERDYECGAFKLLRRLLEKGTLSLEEMVRAVRE